VPTLRIKHAGDSVLEDYPIYPTDPQPVIARRIGQRMAEAGRDLFRQVFKHSDVRQAVKRHLNDTRIEIETEVDDALVPWELLRDPAADLALALAVPSFVRRHLIRGLGEAARDSFDLEVLRAPTFDQRSMYTESRGPSSIHREASAAP
jgi:hypothetical protein